MKLYWGKHSCAIGIHILLEEVGATFDLEELDVQGGETEKQPFKTINPKGKVPVLVRDDGSRLTEYGAIATWLALTYPAPPSHPGGCRGPGAGARDHGLCRRHAARPGLRARLPAGEVRAQGPAAQGRPGPIEHQGRGSRHGREGFAILDRQMEGRPYAGGQASRSPTRRCSIASAGRRRSSVALPPNLAAHYDRMRERPSVRRAREVYGEASVEPSGVG